MQYQNLETYLTSLLTPAFEKKGLDKTCAQVMVSNRPDLCQFQCNGALSGAKQQKKNPIDLAQEIIEEIKDKDLFEKLEIINPGFINISLTDQFLTAYFQKFLKDEEFGCIKVEKPETVVIDFSGPNIAKSMHVGHLRPTIIGDSLCRIFRFAGDRVYWRYSSGRLGNSYGYDYS